MIITWSNFIRRSSTIAQVCSLKDFHIKPIFKKQYLKPLNYLYSFIKSCWLILVNHKKCRVVILVTPPNFLLYLIFWIKIVSKLKIIVDCHNGTFSRKWMKIPLTRFFLNKSDCILIHNSDFYNKINSELSLKKDIIKVVPDPPAIQSTTYVNERAKSNTFLFPASYSQDEPIQELLNVFVSDDFQDRNYEVYLSGPSYKLSREMLRSFKSIKNIYITGFLDFDDYEQLLRKSVGVLCLTKFEGIQLCAINEAIGYLATPIYSNTKTLNKLYSDVGISVGLDLCDLVDKMDYVVNNADELSQRVKLSKEKRSSTWKNNYAQIFKDGQCATNHSHYDTPMKKQCKMSLL